MMKKLFYLILPFALFFGINQVQAFSIDLTPRVAVRDYQGKITWESGQKYKLWNEQYWGTNFYLGSTGSTSPINNLISFQWNNYNLCKGKSFLISGYIGGLFGYFDANSSYEFYNNDSQMQCAYQRIDSSKMKFTCSGIGGGDFLVNFNLNSFVTGTSYQPAISQQVDITCSASNDTIISSNAQNTQDIINNQNQNKNDIINNQNNNQAQTNQGLDNINDSLNNSDTSGSQSELENVNNKFKDDISKSPISDLITLPLKLLTAFNNKLSSHEVCTPYDMGTIFGIHWLQLPCIDPAHYLGNVLWATIDMITTALLLWSIAHKMVKVYISFTSIDGRFVTKIISQTGGML